MKNAAYWAERMTLLQEKLLQKAETLLPETEKAYRRAMLHIQREIEVFYQRYAKEEGLTLAAAKEKLTAAERNDLLLTLEEYIEAAQRNHADPKWIEKLHATSTHVRITRLEALELQMRQQIELLEAQKATAMTKTLADILTEAYYRTGYEVQKGLGIGAAFATLDAEKIKSILAQPWHEDGLNFSERIWGKDRKKLVRELKTTFTDAIIRGESPQKTIDRIQKHLNTSRSNAGRLVLTEGAAFAARGRQEAYERLGTEQYQFLATLDGKTCERCGAMDGKVFRREEYKIGKTAPPLHPHDRCTTVPYFKDEFTKDEQRAARDENGKTYYVPAEMSFQEWKQKFVRDAKELQFEEEGAIMKYISSDFYAINEKLRNAVSLTETEKQMAQWLDAALKKMPYYKGTVSRSMYFGDADAVQKCLGQFRKGNEVRFDGFTSTTCGEELYNPEGEIQIVIRNATKGRNITAFNHMEMEVLYERGVKFQVINIVEEDDMHWIFLEEV